MQAKALEKPLKKLCKWLKIKCDGVVVDGVLCFDVVVRAVTHTHTHTQRGERERVKRTRIHTLSPSLSLSLS